MKLNRETVHHFAKFVTINKESNNISEWTHEKRWDRLCRHFIEKGGLYFIAKMAFNFLELSGNNENQHTQK